MTVIFNHIFGGETFNYNDHLEQDFAAGASLKVIDTRGAVSVHASDDNKIAVVVRKRVGADNQSDADKYNGRDKADDHSDRRIGYGRCQGGGRRRSSC